jgi:hypothetical protein
MPEILKKRRKRKNNEGNKGEGREQKQEQEENWRNKHCILKNLCINGTYYHFTAYHSGHAV